MRPSINSPGSLRSAVTQHQRPGCGTASNQTENRQPSWKSLRPSPHRDTSRDATNGAGVDRGRSTRSATSEYPRLHALSERVRWLWDKGATAPEFASPGRSDHALDVARARACDPSDPRSLAEALNDPLTQDLVLTEGGFWADFLEVFGSALPEDERELAAAWTHIRRSVYEVTDSSEPDSVTLTDLRDGEADLVHDLRNSPTAHARATSSAPGCCPMERIHQLRDTRSSAAHSRSRWAAEHTVLDILDAARHEMSGIPDRRVDSPEPRCLLLLT